MSKVYQREHIYRHPRRMPGFHLYYKGETPRRYVVAKKINGDFLFLINGGRSDDLSADYASVWDEPPAWLEKHGYILFNINKPSCPYDVIKPSGVEPDKFYRVNWRIVRK